MPAILGISVEIRLPKKPTHQAVVCAVIDCACGLQTELIAPAKMLLAPLPPINCQRCCQSLAEAVTAISEKTRNTLADRRRTQEGN